MAGTPESGKKAAESNIARYGQDYYPKLGALGGSKGKADGVTKGFAMMPSYLVAEYGRMGGSIGRRGGRTLPKTQANKIKESHRDTIRLLKEQSDMSVNRLSAKYGKPRSW